MKTPRNNALAWLLACAACCAITAFACGCAPQATSSEGETGESPAADAAGSAEPVAVDWSPSTDCALCHAKEAESTADSACDASRHSALSCTDCHADEAQLSKMHEGATTGDRAPTRLKKTSVAKEACSPCHAQEELAKNSASSTVLTDANQTTVNPHDLPAVDSHGEIACSDCHEMHGDASERAEDARKLCRSCHHQDVYECYTCHQHG